MSVRQMATIAPNLSVEMRAITEGPKLQARHVDGPVIVWAGHMHWLTWRQRISVWLGRSTVLTIAEKRWPHLAKLRREFSR